MKILILNLKECVEYLKDHSTIINGNTYVQLDDIKDAFIKTNIGETYFKNKIYPTLSQIKEDSESLIQKYNKLFGSTRTT